MNGEWRIEMKMRNMFVLIVLTILILIAGCSSESANIEKAYYDAVYSSVQDFTETQKKVHSLMMNNSKSNFPELSAKMGDSAAKYIKIADIKPPSGYEHVQDLFKEGLDDFLFYGMMIIVSLETDSIFSLQSSLEAYLKAENKLTEGLSEIDRLLTSSGTEIVQGNSSLLLQDELLSYVLTSKDWEIIKPIIDKDMSEICSPGFALEVKRYKSAIFKGKKWAYIEIGAKYVVTDNIRYSFMSDENLNNWVEINYRNFPSEFIEYNQFTTNPKFSFNASGNSAFGRR